ncbi:MAG: magnesium transporter CorA family protein [Anaerolineales bacterium]|nr:magnesium transporter CorA family protein [Anaerolineales bacterium]MCX7755374.1 magnesium transporter CorA family protein [Anaerolineales bacterium]MDW8279113.1 magnesium transporter CorA family protein [Anaerolineales bacterium]
MLKFIKSTEQGLQCLDSFVNGCWVSAIDPTPEEVKQLEEWGVYPEYVQYSLDIDEMARTERDEEYTFILIRIPFDNGAAADVPYITLPLGIMLLNNCVVTICKQENEVIRALQNGKYRGLKTAKRYRFALYLLLETATRYLTLLRQINKTTEVIEDRLEKSTRNREVLELLKYQKCLTYFATALRSNEVMMERLRRMQVFNQYEEDQDLLEDVLTENQQAIQMVNIASEVLAALMDAFASVISNNLNVIMKILAALTIALNIPTIVASFYGMNVGLPLQEHPSAFVYIVALAVLLTVLAMYIFYKRDWL